MENCLNKYFADEFTSDEKTEFLIEVDVYKRQAIPSPMIPNVQSASPHFVQRSLRKVGIGLSEGVMSVSYTHLYPSVCKHDE